MFLIDLSRGQVEKPKSPSCAYCGSQGPLTKEHLWPASLHRRLLAANEEEENIFWLRRLQREIGSEPTVRDVCGLCNNGVLSELDNYICDLFDRFFVHVLEKSEKVTFECDYHRLTRWLLKICYNSARIHSSFDVYVFPPLLPYILGKSIDLGRSVQLYLQLSYPGEVPKHLRPPELQPPFLCWPSDHRLGHIRFEDQKGRQKILRAVHLRSYLFYLAFFELNETNALRNEFQRAFLTQMQSTIMLRPSKASSTIICNGIDAWISFCDARNNRFVFDS